jgi:hypothetical protein
MLTLYSWQFRLSIQPSSFINHHVGEIIMPKVQWRPEPNVLTTPRSYRARPVPKDSLGYDEIAIAIAKKNPLWSADLIKSILLAEREEIKRQLINGNQVCLENTCIWNLSLAVRLDASDDQLPSDKDIIKVQINPSRTLIDEVRQGVELERLPPAEKAPVIVGAEDTVLKLRDVLNPDGVLRLTGADMFFEPENNSGECVLQGTQSGWQSQLRFARISNSMILVVPLIPAQSNPWNNEYKVSVATRYTPHGNQRTGIYPNLLRSPLTVSGLSHPHPQETGILTGSASSPHVSIISGAVSADARLRIQAVLDSRTDQLHLSLLDMKEGGAVGAETVVSGNSEHSLTGFSGSPVSSLRIRVNDFAALKSMVRNDYSGRLVDILDVKQES